MQRDRLLLADMLAVGSRIAELVADHSLDDFTTDQTLREAVLWNFTVLGEAASQLSLDLRDRHGEVNWRDPIGPRNRIVHGYASVELDIVYAAGTTGVPKLVDEVRAILHAEFPEVDPAE